MTRIALAALLILASTAPVLAFGYDDYVDMQAAGELPDCGCVDQGWLDYQKNRVRTLPHLEPWQIEHQRVYQFWLLGK